MEYPDKNFATLQVSFHFKKKQKNKTIFVSFNNGHGVYLIYFIVYLIALFILLSTSTNDTRCITISDLECPSCEERKKISIKFRESHK